MKQALQTDLQSINAHLAELRQKYHVKEIGIFGSVAKGTQKTSSDVDILVEFLKPIGFFAFLEVEEYLSALLGKKVDLVTKQSLKPLIKSHILREVVYA